MRFDLGETWDEKFDRMRRWHKWFAWYPVCISAHDYRWLEFVERELRCRVLHDGRLVRERFYRALK